MERVFDVVPMSQGLSFEAARQITLENESAVINLGVRVDDVHLTNPLSFHAAYEKARSGDQSWTKDFDAVGFSLLDSLRVALSEECKRGRIRKLHKEKLSAEMKKEEERTRRHNEMVAKSFKDGIL